MRISFVRVKISESHAREIDVQPRFVNDKHGKGNKGIDNDADKR